MTDIDKLKISLMEKTDEFKTKDGEMKSSCIVKSTAVFCFNEYVSSTSPDASDEERETILCGVADKILHDLIEASPNVTYNHVVVWITVGDMVLENSMDISALTGIGEYGEKGIVPIYELIKITLQ